MLNRLISLVFLLSFLKISIVYSETDFLLPQKKPSIFKKSEKQIQESINKNLPAPKPLLEKKGETKPAVVEQKKEPAKKKDIKTIIKYMKADKKNNSSKINLILIKKIGKVLLDLKFDQSKIKKFLSKELIN